MKKILLVFLLTFSLSAVFGQSKKKETIIIKTTIVCDHCFQCETCGAQINNAIRTSDGIKKIKINPEESTITVTYKPSKTNPEKIRLAIAEAGYDADEIKATPNGYSSLDGCCKAK